MRIRSIHVERFRAGTSRRSVGRSTARSTPMMDLIMLATGLGFFALSVGYAIACDRL
jgi:hypothetical protein